MSEETPVTAAPAADVVAPAPVSLPPLKALLGRKVGMTQIFDESGEAVPVTVVEAGPCHVLQVKTAATDGYNAVQLRFGGVREKGLTQADLGRFKKANVSPARWLREVRVADASPFQVGQEFGPSVFKPGQFVDVSGITKGRGFTGVMKRHNFKGGPATHGQSDRQRAPGSIGSNTYPGHVLKGVRMPGHYGVERVTIQHLEVVKVDPERHLLLIRGAVPGGTNQVLHIRETVKRVKMRVIHKAEAAPKKAAKKEAGAPKAAAEKAKPAAAPKAAEKPKTEKPAK